MDSYEAEAVASIDNYNEALEKYKKKGVGVDSLKAQLAGLLKSPFVLVKSKTTSFEDLTNEVTFSGKSFPDVEFYPYARTWFQQAYDLFTEHHYVLNDKPAELGPRPLSSISGKAKELSDEDSKLFGVQLTGLETICNLYENDQQACIAKYPEWSQIISRVGVGVCKSLSYNKAMVRAYDQGKSLAEAKTTEKRVKNTFKVGLSYSIPEIKKILDKLGFEKPKGTMLSRWFHIKKTTKNGAVAYKILAPLDCFELD